MKHLDTTLAALTISIYAVVIFAILFMFYTTYRSRQVKKVAKYVIENLDQTTIDQHFFNTKVLPVFMKMHSPFTLKKPTLENYFNQEFIDKYLTSKL